MSLIRLRHTVTASLLIVSLWLSPMAWCFSPYSNRELDQLEKEFVEQINQSDQVIRTPLANQYLNHLAKQLAQHGELTQPNFFIVNSNEINAFAGPGGHIGVNSQLILETANESELAAVMAHEMAHVRLHHLYRMLEHEKQMKIPMLASILASIALGAVNPMLGSGALMASLGGFAQNDINFVRSNEKEADRIGIDVLAKAGLDPRGMAAFFQKMRENARYYYTANIPSILRTHPIDEERIAEAENRTAQLKPVNVPDNLTFQLFKEIIRTEVILDEKRLLDYYERCLSKTPATLPCRYGYALELIKLNRFADAETQLLALVATDANNLYFVIALAQAQIGNGHARAALEQLDALRRNHPDNYALLVATSEGLAASGQLYQAVAVLTKATRLYPHDLGLCRSLAQAHANAKRKDYAYFTAARCYQLQGQAKEARHMLKQAASLAKKDPLLRARIEASLDELNEK